MPGPETTAKLAQAVLKELGITRANLDQVQTVPVERIVAAGIAAAKAVFPPPASSKPFDFGRHAELTPWAPTVDGVILPESPFRAGAPAISAKIPLLVGSTRTEFGIGWGWPEFEDFTLGELTDAITKAYGKEKGARVLDGISARPSRSQALRPVRALAVLGRPSIRHPAGFRQGRAGTRRRSTCTCSAWNTPVLDGRIRSYHCAELPFVFDNTDRCDPATGGGPAARALAAKVSEAWIRFARTGNPNHDGLPQWPAFTTEKGATMIFDNACEVANDPDREELDVLAASERALSA